MNKSVVLVALLAVGALSCGDDTEGDAADASSAADADPNAPDADPNAPDADPNAADASTDRTGIACGDAVCTFETQECCLSLLGGDAPMCVDDGQCQEVTLECDGPEDCPQGGGGEAVCCARGGGDATGTSCERANQCNFRACHDENDCPGDAAMCCEVGIFPVNVCAANCNFMMLP